MNREPKNYALLVGVGTYQDEDRRLLPAAGMDLKIMNTALRSGLKFAADNIRMLGEDGSVHARSMSCAVREELAGAVRARSMSCAVREELAGAVRARSFARALSEFENLLEKDDTFVLYFTGHGVHSALCFSDEMVNLQSIVSYIERLPARKKIVIIDCCFSGGMQVSDIRELTFEEAIAAFAGSGIAVMASSAKDERSWLSEAGDVSLYTRIVSAAICSRRNIHKGKISLTDVNDEVRYLMQTWNKAHPDRRQHPIYRENYIGEISFQVEEYHPYITQKITAETEEYYLHSVKPLSTGNLKRFAAFVILKKKDDTLLPKITREIVSQFRNSDVYASAQSEQRFKGRSADAIWCYFGHDAEDIERSNHFAYTIWAGSEELKKQYYRENRNAEIIDGIYIFWNNAYGLVKDLHKTETPQDQILAEYEELAGRLMTKAEAFIRDFEEVENGTFSFTEMKARYGGWISEVKEAYFKLTDADPAPAERIRWAEAILEMAGWVTDLALYLEKDASDETGEQWMVKQAISRYRQALDQLMDTISVQRRI